MKNFTRKVKAISSTFVDGVAAQISDLGTVSLATTLGVLSGVKYTGSISRGVKTGVIVLLSVGVVNGVRNVATNWEAINNT